MPASQQPRTQKRQARPGLPLCSDDHPYSSDGQGPVVAPDQTRWGGGAARGSSSRPANTSQEFTSTRVAETL